MFFVQRRVERAPIDSNTNRHLAIAGLGCHGFDVFWLTNISWIEAQTVHSCFHRSKRHFVLMMNVGDDRHRRTRNYLCQSFSSLWFIARATHDVTAGCSKSINLLQRSFDIGSLSDCHRLNADWRIAANCHLADRNLMRLASCKCTHKYQFVSTAQLCNVLCDVMFSQLAE